MKKPTVTVRPAKTQISLGIRISVDPDEKMANTSVDPDEEHSTLSVDPDEEHGKHSV